ncbi:MAG: hypothetical protein ABIF84_02670 [Patescibacteria group bacterium]
MKRRLIMFCLLGILVVCGFSEKVLSFELRPYLEIGAQIMNEPGDHGDRSNIGIGVEALFNKGDLDYWVNLGLWSTFEATDEKLSAPTGAKHLSFGGRYKLCQMDNGIAISPFFTLGWETWQRNLNPGPEYINRFEDIEFLSAHMGARFQYDRFFLDLGATYPFWNKTDRANLDGKPGYALFLGYKTKMAVFGIFGQNICFAGDENQPSFDFHRIGASMMFRIPF